MREVFVWFNEFCLWYVWFSAINRVELHPFNGIISMNPLQLIHYIYLIEFIWHGIQSIARNFVNILFEFCIPFEVYAWQIFFSFCFVNCDFIIKFIANRIFIEFNTCISLFILNWTHFVPIDLFACNFHSLNLIIMVFRFQVPYQSESPSILSELKDDYILCNWKCSINFVISSNQHSSSLLNLKYFPLNMWILILCHMTHISLFVYLIIQIPHMFLYNSFEWVNFEISSDIFVLFEWNHHKAICPYLYFDNFSLCNLN